MEEKIAGMLRTQAWERAKGELRSMLQTFVTGQNTQYERLALEIEDFIETVESHGLQE